jgi:hypothetical protein
MDSNWSCAATDVSTAPQATLTRYYHTTVLHIYAVE